MRTAMLLEHSNVLLHLLHLSVLLLQQHTAPTANPDSFPPTATGASEAAAAVQTDEKKEERCAL